MRWTKCNISYFDNNRECSPVLLFLHWLWCSKNDFRDAEQYLFQFRTISLDFPGCGLSSYNEKSNITTDDLVDLTHSLIQFLGIKDCFVVGHSYGWLIALKYALKYWVRWLVNVEWLWKMNSNFSARKTLTMNSDQYIREVLPSTILWLQRLNNIWATKYAENLKNVTHPLAFYRYSISFVKSVDQSDSIQEFIEIDIPKLFIYGKNTQWLSFIDEFNGDHQVGAIDDSYHFPNYDNPIDFYRSIQEFIHSVK